MRRILTIALITLISALIVICSPTEASELNGAKIFQANCAGCHPKGGNIIRRGKNLKLKALRRNQVDTLEEITALVTNGKNNMSAYGDKLTPQEIAEVSAFVRRQAELGWK